MQSIRIFWLVLLSTSFGQSMLYSGGGSSFGWFAGGVLTGAVITSAAKSNNCRRCEQPTYVVQQPAQPQVIYVQQPQQPAPAIKAQSNAVRTDDVKELRELVYKQQQEIDRLKEARY